MKDIYLISDPHFSDWDMLAVCNRPFGQLTEMNETIVERWNSVVRPQDHVYCLGDVAMKRKELEIVRRLNGHKRLIFGNHDIFEYKEYVKVGFQKLMAYRVLDNVIMSHIPIALTSMGRFLGNIHGHIHTSPDLVGPYLNVSVEKINYTPIHFDEAKSRLENK
jgi:calcineurin-like phosphoesterase family protein